MSPRTPSTLADDELAEPLLQQSPNPDETNSSSDNDVAPTITTLTDPLTDPWRNPNVRTCFLLCIVSGIADSIWGSVILSGFLFALGRAMHQDTRDNTLVGLAEMVQGISKLVFAIPVGMLADRTGKARVVRWGGILMLIAVALTVWALVIVKNDALGSVQAADMSYTIMVAALGFWGVVSAFTDGPAQALFADSVPKGQRSELYTWLYGSYLAASATGPVVAICMLTKSSAEDWSLAEIFPVFLVGVLLEIPAAILMFFYSDKYIVPELEEPSSIASTQQPATIETITEDVGTFMGSEEPDTVLTDMSTRASGMFTVAAIPYVLFFSSLVTSLASGASVKYFPLYFKDLGLASGAVQGIFLAVPLSISAFSFVSTRVSKRLGRIETIVLFSLFGISLLYLMTFLSEHVTQGNVVGQVFVVAIYLLRTGIMNCSYPLLESILMDAVPSNQRAQWKSLESIASFGWTGSALVGGILSDHHSYEYTFRFTATMQLIGSLMLLSIQSLVEDEDANERAPTAVRNMQAADANDLSQPLLSPA
jgi:MFS family permease